MQGENKNATANEKTGGKGWISFILATLCTLLFLALFCIMEFAESPKINMFWEKIVGVLIFGFGWFFLAIIGIIGLISSIYTLIKRPLLWAILLFYMFIIIGFTVWFLKGLSETHGP